MAEFSVEAIVLNPKGHELYCFGMNTSRLNQICYVTPRSHDDPDEIQRIIRPGRAKEIGEYIQQANSLLPNSVVVSLTEDVTISSGGSATSKVLNFPDVEGKFAYILDGQHRLEGFKYSEGVEFDLPVVALYNADEALRAKIFADINSKQQRVNDVHLLALYYQIRDLPQDISAVMDMITRLNGDADSPLMGRVQTLDDDKNWWVKNTTLKQYLSPILASGGVLAAKNVAQQTEIMKAYLGGITELWPEAWGDEKDYLLCRATGMQIIFGIFPSAMHRCDLNCSRQYTAANFHEQMKPLLSAKIQLLGLGESELDWQRGGIISLVSNARTRELIIRQLRDYLTVADG